MALVEPEHQGMNKQVEVTRRTLLTIAHSLMVHARVSEPYIHFSLMYTTDNIFSVLPITDMINEDGDLTTLYKLATGTKTFGIVFTRVILSMCCTESYCTR